MDIDFANMSRQLLKTRLWYLYTCVHHQLNQDDSTSLSTTSPRTYVFYWLFSKSQLLCNCADQRSKLSIIINNYVIVYDLLILNPLIILVNNMNQDFLGRMKFDNRDFNIPFEIPSFNSCDTYRDCDFVHLATSYTVGIQKRASERESLNASEYGSFLRKLGLGLHGILIRRFNFRKIRRLLSKCLKNSIPSVC